MITGKDLWREAANFYFSLWSRNARAYTCADECARTSELRGEFRSTTCCSVSCNKFWNHITMNSLRTRRKNNGRFIIAVHSVVVFTSRRDVTHVRRVPFFLFFLLFLRKSYTSVCEKKKSQTYRTSYRDERGAISEFYNCATRIRGHERCIERILNYQSTARLTFALY